MKSHLLQFCAFALLLLLSPRMLRAEFIKTSSFTYQSDDERTKAIVSPGVETVSGIFIASGKAIPLQLFDPSVLKEEETTSFFLQFNSTSNRFTKIIIGRNAYEIKGSFSLKLEHARISLDQHDLSSYLSIVTENKDETASILGFSGVTEVINLSGKDVVRLLEANALQKSYKNILKDYSISKENLITFENLPISVNYIGVEFDVKNPCLTQNSAILSGKVIEQMNSLGDKLTEVEKIISIHNDKTIVENMLFLQITETSIVGLSYTQNELKKIKFIKEIQLAENKYKICAIEE